MEMPPPDLGWFTENLTDTVREIIDAWGDAGAVAARDEASPELVRDALDQLIEVLRLHEWPQEPPGQSGELKHDEVDVSELGDYGLNMLLELSKLAIDLGLEPLTERLEQLALGLARWIVTQGGELESIDLVVNAVARLANKSNQPHELDALFYVMGELVDATLPLSGDVVALDQDPDPRQLLLLNRAIVATRALSPELMEIAFSDVAEQLPDQAPAFFREGIEQVKQQGYPDNVREVIERYCLEWPLAKILH